jgi:hypothetical protein
MCASTRLQTQNHNEPNRNKIQVPSAGKGDAVVSENEAEFGTHPNLRNCPIFNFDQDQRTWDPIRREQDKWKFGDHINKKIIALPIRPALS